MKFGSHLYGTNTENSDLDIKALYLPTAREILLGNYKRTIQTIRPKADGEKNTKDDVDLEILSLDRFIELLLQGQTMALDMLFAPSDMYVKENTTIIGELIMADIYNNRHQFLNKNVNAFVGYARQQAAKYGQKGFRLHAIRSALDYMYVLGPSTRMDGLDENAVPNWIESTKNEHIKIVLIKDQTGKDIKHLDVAGRSYPFTSQVRYIRASLEKRFSEYGARAILAEKNEGIDWKALSHAVRVNSEAQELLATSRIIFPRPDKDLLLDIKLGRMKYTDVADIIEKGLEDLKSAETNSILQAEPNREFAQDYIVKVYGMIVRGEM